MSTTGKDTYPIRGNVFVGRVVSAKPQKTVIIERENTRYLPKYERYQKSKSRIPAHNPDEVGAKEGDIVRIGETRRISKTKSFVVMEVLGHKDIAAREEGETLVKSAKKSEAEVKDTKEEQEGEEQ